MQDTKFSYSTQPHAAPVKRRPKYREEDAEQPPNLMNDPRIVRGNTYAAKVLSNSLKREQLALQTDNERRSKAERMKTRTTSGRSTTPPPVDGRMHMDIQTDDFLEELNDRPIEVDAETQTQPFMDQPSSPLFVPAKTGQDMMTQIEPDDLFDFDMEVEPILEVLVGKTLHVSMLELMQEEELEAIRRQQEEFEYIRNIELAEVQRLEADARRRMQEKERRLEQEQLRLAQKIELEEKIAARAFAQQYLSSLHTSVFDMLQDEGYFYDVCKKEIEDIFMVDLIAGYKERVSLYSVAQLMAEELLNVAREKAKEVESLAIKIRLQHQAEEAERIRFLKEEETRKAAEAAAKAAEELGEEL